MKRCLSLITVAATCALLPVSAAVAADGPDLARGPSGGGDGQSLRVVLLGLRSDERALTRFVRRVSRPGARRYARYLNPRKLRHRYGAARGVRRRVLDFLGSQDGVDQIDTAYGTDKLNARGLKGQGMRVAILSSAFVDESAFAT